MRTLLRSCAEVREPIELSFGVVSGVGLGILLLDGGPGAPRQKGATESCCPIGFNGVFLHRNIFDSCVKS